MLCAPVSGYALTLALAKTRDRLSGLLMTFVSIAAGVGAETMKA
ncbi:hypothetical protein [Mycobacterium sp.]